MSSSSSLIVIYLNPAELNMIGSGICSVCSVHLSDCEMGAVRDGLERKSKEIDDLLYRSSYMSVGICKQFSQSVNDQT